MTSIKCRTVAQGDITLNVEGALRRVVDCSPDYHAGAVESANSKVDKLTELVAALFETLPVERAVQILNDNHYEPFRLEQCK